MATVNAWIKYSAQHDKPVTHTEFLETVLREGLHTFDSEDENEENTIQPPVSNSIPTSDTPVHSEVPVDSCALSSPETQIELEDNDAPIQQSSSLETKLHVMKTDGRCVRCTYCKHKSKSNTTIYCSACNVPIHSTCFQKYHEERFGNK